MVSHENGKFRHWKYHPKEPSLIGEMVVEVCIRGEKLHKYGLGLNGCNVKPNINS